MWVLTLLGAWLVVGLPVALLFAVLARGGRGSQRAAKVPRTPSSPRQR
jgi:hypothetical protein